MTSDMIEGYNLSPQQKHLWWLSEGDDTPAFRVRSATLIEGELDRAALSHALNQIVGRHTILRSAFRQLGTAAPRQVVLADSGAPAIRQHNLGPLGERELARASADLATRPADAGAPLHLDLARLGPDRHILSISLSALCADAQSLTQIIREISQAYAATISGQTLPAAEIVQYADAAEVFNELIESEDTAAGRDYWRQQKSQLADLLTPPLAQAAGPAGGPWRPAVIEVAVPAATAAALGPLAESAGADVATVFQAAWLVQLNRLSGQDEIVVGVAYDGRGYEGLDTAVGLFARYLPIRHQLPQSLSFAAAVAQVKERLENAVEWQEYFIWDHLAQRPGGAGPRPALCAYGFDSAELPAPWQAGGLRWSDVQHAAHSERFHLRLAVSHCAGAWRMAFHYDPALFTAAEIARIAARQLTLLENAAARPESAIGAIDLLPAEERALLERWNATATTYAAALPIHQLIAAQAARTPAAVAVQLADQALSYAQLNARANQLAHALIRQGVGPDSLVGVCLERSLDLVVALLAILKAGGAYVPLDPGYPAERLAFMLADSGVAVLLTAAAAARHLPPHAVPTIALDQAAPSIALAPTHDPVVALADDHLAYMIYTSGSTGRPKGAMNTHGAIRNRLLWMQAQYRLTPADRVLQKTPVSFDVSVWEFFWPLLSGATLVLARPEGHKDPAYLAALIQQAAITTLHFVPAMLQAFVEEPAAAACPSLRRIICSGEALPLSLQERVFARLGAVELHNLYGPTEAAVDVSFWACRPERGRSTVPIGAPVANTRLCILDRAGGAAPIGVAGELHIGGVQLARGYHGRPELTAEKFVPDPWSAAPGGRLYRTGDLARWAEDGSIEYLGRLDHQVKIRGFRIELGEIESALLDHESVREAVVVAREVEHLPGDKRLVAYVVLNVGYAEADDALRAFLGTTLPEHMVPALFVFVDALPLTPSGKLDRQALPAPRRKIASPDDLVAPRTPVEEKLAAIWREVLQLPAVGMHDNFFELGGDSILSIQIVAKAGNAGLQLKPNALFTHRTIAELASVVNAAPAISAEQGLVEGAAPLTPAQSLFFARDVAEPHHWNQTLLFELRERLAITALEQAVQQLILHHDALRMRFSAAAGAWSQRNAGADDQTLCSLVDLGALPVAEQAAALEQAAAAAQQSLDLANGPLLRAALFDLGPASRQRLLLTIHHLVVDGVSWRILLEDLQAAYAQVLQGQAVRLPAKTSSYKQWAERLAAHAQSPELAGEASYWLDLGRRSAALPTDYAAHSGDNLVGSEQTVAVRLPSAESLALLQEVPSAYQTTINDVLLTALTMACAPWTGAPALSLYLEGHGREELFADIDLSRTVGWFTALYPVELALAAPSGPGESLKAIKEQLRRVPQRGIGYGLLRYLSGDRRLADLPEPQLCFNYLGQLDQAIAADSLLALAEESAGPARSPRGRRLFLLEVNAALVGGQLQVEWTFSDRFHQRQTIERLAERFIGELRSLIQHCQSPAAGGYTPSDFPDEDLNDSDLDAILAQIGDF